MLARSVRRGAALIEALIALVVLAVAGTALITHVGQTTRSLMSLRNTEREIHAAELELGNVVVLGRHDLAARTGVSISHGWHLEIARVSPDLFDVAIAASDTSVVLLHTTLYRPDSMNASQP